VGGGESLRFHKEKIMEGKNKENKIKILKETFFERLIDSSR